MDFTATQTALNLAFNTVAVVGAIALSFQFVVGFVSYSAAPVVSSHEEFVAEPITGDHQPVDEDPDFAMDTDMDITLDSLAAWDQRFAALPDVWEEPAISDMCQVLPFTRRQSAEPVKDYSSWTVQELRSLFNRKGLKWRKAASDGKHLRKQEMINILLEVNAA